jgi:hypothetical protein
MERVASAENECRREEEEGGGDKWDSRMHINCQEDDSKK